MSSRWQIVRAFAITLLFVTPLGWFFMLRPLIAHGKSDLTGFRIHSLAAALEISMPDSVERSRLLAALRQVDRSEELLLDGWGRPFSVSIVGSGEDRSYRIVSLGSDNALGPCCVGRWQPMGAHEADWVMLDGELVQYAQPPPSSGATTPEGRHVREAVGQPTTAWQPAVSPGPKRAASTTASTSTVSGATTGSVPRDGASGPTPRQAR